jgi:hypothetical protein
MSWLSLVVLAAGVALVAYGWTRARGPYARYQALRRQDENVARYEKWRGGVRSTEPTGASVAMAMLRRQARVGFVIAGVGAGLIILAFGARL